MQLHARWQGLPYSVINLDGHLKISLVVLYAANKSCSKPPYNSRRLGFYNRWLKPKRCECPCTLLPLTLAKQPTTEFE